MTPLPGFPGPRASRAIALVILAGVVLLGLKGTGLLDAALVELYGLSDAQVVWCAAHPIATIDAAAGLGLPAPSRFVEHKAAVEQASLDGNDALAASLMIQWVGQEVTATDSDPHPGLASMPSWAADDRAGFQRACRAVAP